MGYVAQGQEAVTGRAELRMQAIWVRGYMLNHRTMLPGRQYRGEE